MYTYIYHTRSVSAVASRDETRLRSAVYSLLRVSCYVGQDVAVKGRWRRLMILGILNLSTWDEVQGNIAK